MGVGIEEGRGGKGCATKTLSLSCQGKCVLGQILDANAGHTGWGDTKVKVNIFSDRDTFTYSAKVQLR